MSAAHTPGPWFVESDGAGVYVLSADLMVACPSPVDKHPTDSDEYIDGPETEANARLIAAAPDLLAFVQGFLADYRSEDGMYDMKHYARKAHELVAKATGEGA